ncbi:MAG: phage holin family protein [Chthoniobacterales bacterium]|nr:phage holin family protein [Chthoniobacterales bacterium]
MMEFLIRWTLTALVAFTTPSFMPNMAISDLPTSLILGVVIGFVDAFLRPVLLRIVHGLWFIPVIGFSLFLANWFLLLFAGSALPGITISDWTAAPIAALPPAITCWLLSLFFVGDGRKLHFITYHGRRTYKHPKHPKRHKPQHKQEKS